jgi:hypothetical protein
VCAQPDGPWALEQVDVTTHAGYLGGLEATLKSGARAPYHATATVETIFHVATWMPTDPSDPQQVKKASSAASPLQWHTAQRD